jgi:hypothetical protein
MLRRLPIILGMLGCGVIGLAALWAVMDSGLAAVPKVAAWLGFFVAGAAALLLFIMGLMRNTREAKAAQQNVAAAAPRPSFLPMAPDPSLARDAAELLRIPPMRVIPSGCHASTEPSPQPRWCQPNRRSSPDPTGCPMPPSASTRAARRQRSFRSLLPPRR